MMGESSQSSRRESQEVTQQHIKQLAQVCSQLIHTLEGVNPAVADHPGMAEAKQTLQALLAE
jgi:hypothetical protein